MTGKYKWRDAKHFFDCDLGEVVDHSRLEDDEDDSCRTVRVHMTRRIDGDDYQLSMTHQWGVEGESYSEQWTRNDEFHRLGKMPARLWVDEGPCAEGDDGNNRRAMKVYCVHGKRLKTEETASKIGDPIAEPDEDTELSR